jgi:hypothetical protein
MVAAAVLDTNSSALASGRAFTLIHRFIRVFRVVRQLALPTRNRSIRNFEMIAHSPISPAPGLVPQRGKRLCPVPDSFREWARIQRCPARSTPQTSPRCRRASGSGGAILRAGCDGRRTEGGGQWSARIANWAYTNTVDCHRWSGVRGDKLRELEPDWARSITRLLK